MTATRVQLRSAAVVWQQTAVCEPDLEQIVASPDEVAGWGAGLPLDTDELARAAIGDRVFYLISAPGAGVAWVAAEAFEPGDQFGRAVLVMPSTAYAVQTRCDWRGASAEPDGSHTVWQLEGASDGPWLSLRRLVRGKPIGPLCCVAAGDVVERWTVDAPDGADPIERADAGHDVAGPAGVGDLTDDSAPPAPESTATRSATEALLAFLGRNLAEADAARLISAGEATGAWTLGRPDTSGAPEGVTPPDTAIESLDTTSTGAMSLDEIGADATLLEALPAGASRSALDVAHALEMLAGDADAPSAAERTRGPSHARSEALLADATSPSSSVGAHRATNAAGTDDLSRTLAARDPARVSSRATSGHDPRTAGGLPSGSASHAGTNAALGEPRADASPDRDAPARAPAHIGEPRTAGKSPSGHASHEHRNAALGARRIADAAPDPGAPALSTTPVGDRRAVGQLRSGQASHTADAGPGAPRMADASGDHATDGAALAGSNAIAGRGASRASSPGPADDTNRPSRARSSAAPAAPASSSTSPGATEPGNASPSAPRRGTPDAAPPTSSARRDARTARATPATRRSRGAPDGVRASASAPRGDGTMSSSEGRADSPRRDGSSPMLDAQRTDGTMSSSEGRAGDARRDGSSAMLDAPRADGTTSSSEGHADSARRNGSSAMLDAPRAASTMSSSDGRAGDARRDGSSAMLDAPRAGTSSNTSAAGQATTTGTRADLDGRRVSTTPSSSTSAAGQGARADRDGRRTGATSSSRISPDARAQEHAGSSASIEGRTDAMSSSSNDTGHGAARAASSAHGAVQMASPLQPDAGRETRGGSAISTAHVAAPATPGARDPGAAHTAAVSSTATGETATSSTSAIDARDAAGTRSASSSKTSLGRGDLGTAAPGASGTVSAPGAQPAPRQASPTASTHTGGEPGSADRHEAPRGRIAIARRGGDDLGLPSLPPPNRGSAAPAPHDDRPAPSAAGNPHAPEARPDSARTAARTRDDAGRSVAIATAPATTPTAPATSTPTAQRAPIAPLTAPIAQAAPGLDAAPAASAPAPARPEVRRPTAPSSLDMPIAALVEPASLPIAMPGPSRRQTINREVRVGDIAVEIGDALPPSATVEHAGALTSAIPRRGTFDHVAAMPRHGLQPRRRL